MKWIFESIGGNKKINAKQGKKERNKGKDSLKEPPKIRSIHHKIICSWVVEKC